MKMERKQKKRKKKKVAQTASSRANLIFPVGRIHRNIKDNVQPARVGKSAIVYMTGACEYVMQEILRQAIDQAKGLGRFRITRYHISRAIHNNPAFKNVFQISCPEEFDEHKVKSTHPRSKGKASTRTNTKKKGGNLPAHVIETNQGNEFQSISSIIESRIAAQEEEHIVKANQPIKTKPRKKQKESTSDISGTLNAATASTTTTPKEKKQKGGKRTKKKKQMTNQFDLLQQYPNTNENLSESNSHLNDGTTNFKAIAFLDKLPANIS